MRQHQMPDDRARLLASALVLINQGMDARGRCVECGEPNRDGCGCWLQDMFNQVPLSIILLMDEIEKKAKS